MYIQQLHAFSGDVAQECREAEETTKTQLSSMNLPSALEVSSFISIFFFFGNSRFHLIECLVD